jgi:hypothetical protein
MVDEYNNIACCLDVCLDITNGPNRAFSIFSFFQWKLSRDILIKTKDIVQGLGYDLVYADTDSVFIKSKDHATTARNYEATFIYLN